ncbi:MAG: RNA ligase family protein [Candidatus Nanopelagicales bacterium]
MASLSMIHALVEIPGADAIEAAQVRGWWVVVRKGEFSTGERVWYFEIDSMLPLDHPAFEFLRPRGAKTLGDGREVHVLRTARLRGQVSQGLVLPQSAITPEEAAAIEKYEPPIPVEMNGLVLRPFPTDLFLKTDAERVQNITDEQWDEIQHIAWYPTEKIDGMSITVFTMPDSSTPRYCTRNYEIIPQPSLTICTTVADLSLEPPPGWGFQGELYGEGIQGNPLGICGQKIAVFNVFQWHEDLHRFRMVPRLFWPDQFFDRSVPFLPFSLPETREEALDQAAGLTSRRSTDVNHLAEGVVWHASDAIPRSFLNGRACFKVISNRYLLKHHK